MHCKKRLGLSALGLPDGRHSSVNLAEAGKKPVF